MKVVLDFDAFTQTIAGNDPDKMVTLERGPMNVYWAVANGYAKRLVAEQERTKRAKKRHGR